MKIIYTSFVVILLLGNTAFSMGKKPIQPPKILPNQALWEGDYALVSGSPFCEKNTRVTVEKFNLENEKCPQGKETFVRLYPLATLVSINCGVIESTDPSNFFYRRTRDTTLVNTENGQAIKERRGRVGFGPIQWNGTSHLSVTSQGTLHWDGDIVEYGPVQCEYTKR